MVWQIVIIEARQPDAIAGTFAVPADGPHGLDLRSRRLFCACDDGRLVTLDARTGTVASELTLNGTPQRSLRVRGNRALLQLRRQKTRTKPAHDLLQSILIDSMTVQWEHADSGFTPGAAGMDDLVVGMPTADGEVILIR